MKNLTILSLALLAAVGQFACSGGSESGSSSGDGDDGGVSTGDGDSGASGGDGDAAGDGDGDTSTEGDGDGDGDSGTSPPGDGDGDATHPGDGDGDTSPPGDGDGDGDAPEVTDLTPGGTEIPGRTCTFDGPHGIEELAPWTSIFFDNGCTHCTCFETEVECRPAFGCEEGEPPPSDCGDLDHRESRLSTIQGCTTVERCDDGEIQVTENCGTGGGGEPSGCTGWDEVSYRHGERASDGGDGGACYCLYGEIQCLF